MEKENPKPNQKNPRVAAKLGGKRGFKSAKEKQTGGPKGKKWRKGLLGGVKKRA